MKKSKGVNNYFYWAEHYHQYLHLSHYINGEYISNDHMMWWCIFLQVELGKSVGYTVMDQMCSNLNKSHRKLKES